MFLSVLAFIFSFLIKSTHQESIHFSIPLSSSVSFGILTDIHYGDIDNSYTSNGRLKYHRNALDQVDKAYEYWNKRNDIEFVLILGDLIDYLNAEINKSEDAISKLNQKLASSKYPTYTIYGNHDWYNFKRSSGARTGDANLGAKSYYKFKIGFKFIAIDCYDISVLGYKDTDAKFKQASQILEDNIRGRFNMENGAVGDDQLIWLEEELEESDKLGERVIIYGHSCLSPGSCVESCLLWNYQEVVHLLNIHQSAVLYLNGHSHIANHSTDATSGVTYVVFPALTETLPDKKAFSTVTIRDGIISVHEEDGEKFELSMRGKSLRN